MHVAVWWGMVQGLHADHRLEREAEVASKLCTERHTHTHTHTHIHTHTILVQAHVATF